MREEGLVYRISDKERKNNTGDYYFDAILDELNFYRTYFGGGETKEWRW